MKVVIAGYGIEGKASYYYWNRLGDDITIADERDEIDAPAGAKTILGLGAFGKLGSFDLIVRSPGVSPKKLPYPGKVWSATNEFFARAEVTKTPIIGVTGTKGKGTTSSLIHGILKEAGINSLLVGNIGKPALDVLDGLAGIDVVIYELSSFQLWDLKKSPHIAVVLGIETDHLDVHETMEEYVNAKANIRCHQTESDYCYYHPTNRYSEQIARTSENDSTESEKNACRYASQESVYVESGRFVDASGEISVPVDALQLPGAHNIENACAAIAAVMPLTRDSIAIQRGLAAFSGLDHRLKFVSKVNGVAFYDDSIATTPGSAIAALKSFEQPKVIILGGSDKGADFGELIEVCRETNAQVVAVGQTGGKIAELCRGNNIQVHVAGSAPMSGVVNLAFNVATSGSVVILSPASASFDMYKNYSERGNAFIEAVGQLRKAS